MKTTAIDFGRGFEQVLKAVRSLPTGFPGNAVLTDETDLRQVIRGLYEAANGCRADTPFASVACAPPVAAFLTQKPFQVATQLELLIEAATRLISHSCVWKRHKHQMLPITTSITPARSLSLPNQPSKHEFKRLPAGHQNQDASSAQIIK